MKFEVPKYTAALLKKYSKRNSILLRQIYYWYLNHKNKSGSLDVAIFKVRSLFDKTKNNLIPYVYRTRVQKQIGIHAKYLNNTRKIQKSVDQYVLRVKIVFDDVGSGDESIFPMDLRDVGFHPRTRLEARVNYWVSPEGMLKRMDMIGQDFIFQIVNNSLQAFGVSNDVKGFLGREGFSSHCDYCSGNIIGKFFYQGRYLPRLPAHNNCTCEWEIVKKDK